jgi:hypothetical protein
MSEIPGCGSGGWTLVMKVDGNQVNKIPLHKFETLIHVLTYRPNADLLWFSTVNKDMHIRIICIWQYNLFKLMPALEDILFTTSVVTSHQQVESRVESFYYLVKLSRVNGLTRVESESNQWLRQLYGEQKGKQQCHFTSGNMPICIENYFLFIQALPGLFPTYSTTIFWWIYHEQVVTELTRVI